MVAGRYWLAFEKKKQRAHAEGAEIAEKKLSL